MKNINEDIHTAKGTGIMDIPPDYPLNFGSYNSLRKRIIQGLRSAKVDDQIIGMLRNACDQALKESNLVLSHPEKERLSGEVMKAVLTDTLARLGRTE
jgi:hypothetical protein